MPSTAKNLHAKVCRQISAQALRLIEAIGPEDWGKVASSIRTGLSPGWWFHSEDVLRHLRLIMIFPGTKRTNAWRNAWKLFPSCSLPRETHPKGMCHLYTAGMAQGSAPVSQLARQSEAGLLTSWDLSIYTWWSPGCWAETNDPVDLLPIYGYACV